MTLRLESRLISLKVKNAKSQLKGKKMVKGMKMWQYVKLATFIALGLAFSACGENKGSSSDGGVSINRPECIAPAAPGGGFDLTCKLIQVSLAESKLIEKPMRVTFMPGGLGVVAYNSMITNRSKDANVVVAFSSGTLLNIAMGKHGKYNENDVRWLASGGVDYGTIVVKSNSTFQNLGDLINALKQNPQSVSFGAGGSIGGQDWMQTALVARIAGLDTKTMRYVAFEGGGEALTALLGGHVQAIVTGASEISSHINSGDVRVLAVFAENRLDSSDFKDIPTAKEQGYDVLWPIIRGYYMAPQVSDEEYQWWLDIFSKLWESEAFKNQREFRGLFEFNKSGKEFDTLVKEQTNKFRELIKEFDLQ